MADLFPKRDAKSASSATQQFVEIAEVKDGVVMIKGGGGLRMLLQVSSINFALKSTEEQTAIIAQFQDFLNSLDFSLQIFINSRKLDIEPYLLFLSKIIEQQKNELLKIQTQEYIDFIRTMVASQSIMNKKFFVVIPYDRVMVGGKQFGMGDSSAANSFNRDKNQLLQRVDHVMLGLRRIGVKSELVDSESALNLFAQLYHPSVEIKSLNLPTQGLANFS